MNNKSRSDCVKGRFTRGSERKKKEEEDAKKRKKTEKVVCLSNRTRLEEKNMRFLEEKHLRSENVGIEIIFQDVDDDSVTSVEILNDEVTFRVKKLFKANVSNNLGARTLNGIACFSYDKMIQFMKIYISIYFTSLEDKDHSSGVI